jgi:hypothetical protein
MYEAFCLKDSFYSDLKPFHQFHDLTNQNHFSAIPRNWNIIITDIKGSTTAVKEGLYREVNLVGAASIVVAKKVLKKEFPFVFGGDGATLLIPEDESKIVLESLEDLKQLSLKNFGLDLRVGIISMSEILAQGQTIEVAKYELTQGRYMAMIRGHGIVLAEELIKKNPTKYQHDLKQTREADLSGLTCRWQPNPSQKGAILTLLVQARDPSLKIYEELFKRFEVIFPEGIEEHNPAIAPQGQYKSIWTCLKDEARYQKSLLSFSFLKRLLEIIPAYFVFNLKLPIPSTRQYVKSTPSHSDFRKFDQTLRMVIDCSDSQVQSLSKYLEELYQAKLIFYGLNLAKQSLMTCFVEGLNQGEHFHFIDADNGGYVMASLQLKEQIRLSTIPNSEEA